MKKSTFLLALCIVFGSAAFTQSELLVGWTFSGELLVADTGLSLHPDNEISTIGGTSEIELKNGFTSKAAQATEWNLGMETKAWMIKAKTTGYNNLTISSRQQSGGEDPGPKYFKIQFSINNGASWSEVIGGEITVENDWETSFVDKLPLPADCNEKDDLWIRWVMALNIASGNGGSVAADGKSKIDNIYLHGDKINGIEDHLQASFNLFPNPATEFVKISSNNIMTSIQISDVTCKTVFQKVINTQLEKVDLSNLPGGIYFITIQNKDDHYKSTQKLLVQ